MVIGNLNWIVSYIWGIADDVLRDLYVRGKYRDVILPMTVLRRLDAVLEDNHQAVLDMKASLDKAGIVEQDQSLRVAACQSFYNTSKFTMRDLKARASQQQLRSDFEAYLDGFSPNVQDILDNFEFRNQISRLSRADALGTMIDNLVHIAHTVTIGLRCVIAAGAIVAGNSTIGDNVWVGPGVTITNSVSIGDGAYLTLGSVVGSNVGREKKMTGFFCRRPWQIS